MNGNYEVALLWWAVCLSSISAQGGGDQTAISAQGGGEQTAISVQGESDQPSSSGASEEVVHSPNEMCSDDRMNYMIDNIWALGFSSYKICLHALKSKLRPNIVKDCTHYRIQQLFRMFEDYSRPEVLTPWYRTCAQELWHIGQEYNSDLKVCTIEAMERFIEEKNQKFYRVERSSSIWQCIVVLAQNLYSYVHCSPEIMREIETRPIRRLQNLAIEAVTRRCMQVIGDRAFSFSLDNIGCQKAILDRIIHERIPEPFYSAMPESVTELVKALVFHPTCTLPRTANSYYNYLVIEEVAFAVQLDRTIDEDIRACMKFIRERANFAALQCPKSEIQPPCN